MKDWGKIITEKKAKQLRLLGMDVVDKIEVRTSKGLDKNLKSFKPYTSEYKKLKQKKYGRTKVDLRADGDMLGSMNVKNIRNGIRIYFIGKEQNAKAAGNNKKRKFFGLDKNIKKYINKTLNK